MVDMLLGLQEKVEWIAAEGSDGWIERESLVW